MLQQMDAFYIVAWHTEALNEQHIAKIKDVLIESFEKDSLSLMDPFIQPHWVHMRFLHQVAQFKKWTNTFLIQTMFFQCTKDIRNICLWGQIFRSD